MNNNTEVIHNILPLLETLEEGFGYIQEQLSQLRYEEALKLLEDAAMGILSIDQAIEPMTDDLGDNNIATLGATLKTDMSQVVTSYEANREENVEKQIQGKVIVSFKSWKDEIERVLRPYVDA